MRLENTDIVEQCVWDAEDDGKRYTIPPGETMNFPPRIAALFLEECAGSVIEFADANVPVEPGAREVWVANNTGSPEFPETFTYTEYDSDKKARVPITIPHPLFRAHTIKHDWDPGQKDMIIHEKLVPQANLPSIRIRMPPYHRRKLPASVVYAWMNCLGLGPEECSKALIQSRAPLGHEPNETWSLDAILTFGELTHKGFVYENGLRYKHEVGVDEVKLDEMKKKALHAWYFISINPSVRLPSEEVWEAKKASIRSQVQSGDKKLGKKSG